MFSQFIFHLQWKLSLDKPERPPSFERSEINKLYSFNSGSKIAGQRWKEVAENINSNEGFQIGPRDQSSEMEHFHKLLADFKVKMTKEGTSSGTFQEPLTPTEEILGEIAEITTNKPIAEGDEGELEAERVPFYTEFATTFPTWNDILYGKLFKTFSNIYSS